MLPIDELIKKAGMTTTTTLQAMIPQLWSAQIEKNLRMQAVFEPSLLSFADLMVPGAGNTLYVPSLPDLSHGVEDLTEGTDTNTYPLDAATSVAFTPTERGVGIEITRKTLDRIGYDGIAEIVDRLGYDMLVKIESAIAALYNASVPGTSNKLASYYPNGKTSATVAATDTLSSAALLNARLILQQSNNMPFPDGYFRMFISPKQASDLFQDTNVRNDIHYGAPQAVFSGEIGALHGIRLIVTNFVKSVTENTVPVYKNMLVAPRWAAVAYKRKPELVVDPTVYDYGRRRRLAVLADYDIELLHAERGVTVTTA